MGDFPALSSNFGRAQTDDITAKLFEPSQAICDIVYDEVSSGRAKDYSTLIDLVEVKLMEIVSKDTVSPEFEKTVLACHPRLGEKRVKLSAASTREQKSLSQGATRLVEANEKYENRFAGLRFVTFVNGRDTETILKELDDRVAEGNIKSERQRIISAICDIARDRFNKSKL